MYVYGKKLVFIFLSCLYTVHLVREREGEKEVLSFIFFYVPAFQTLVKCWEWESSFAPVGNILTLNSSLCDPQTVANEGHGLCEICFVILM